MTHENAMILVRQRKILESQNEPADRKWLWLSTEDKRPMLYTHYLGKWTPVLGKGTEITYDAVTRTLNIE